MATNKTILAVNKVSFACIAAHLCTWLNYSARPSSDLWWGNYRTRCSVEHFLRLNKPQCFAIKLDCFWMARWNGKEVFFKGLAAWDYGLVCLNLRTVLIFLNIEVTLHLVRFLNLMFSVFNLGACSNEPVCKLQSQCSKYKVNMMLWSINLYCWKVFQQTVNVKHYVHWHKG